MTWRENNNNNSSLDRAEELEDGREGGGGGSQAQGSNMVMRQKTQRERQRERNHDDHDDEREQKNGPGRWIIISVLACTKKPGIYVLFSIAELFVSNAWLGWWYDPHYQTSAIMAGFTTITYS